MHAQKFFQGVVGLENVKKEKTVLLNLISESSVNDFLNLDKKNLRLIQKRAGVSNVYTFKKICEIFFILTSRMRSI